MAFNVAMQTRNKKKIKKHFQNNYAINGNCLWPLFIKALALFVSLLKDFRFFFHVFHFMNRFEEMANSPQCEVSKDKATLLSAHFSLKPVERVKKEKMDIQWIFVVISA